MKTLWRSTAAFKTLESANDVCRKLEATYHGSYFLPFKRAEEEGSPDSYGVFTYDRLTDRQQEVFDAYISGFQAAIEFDEWEEGGLIDDQR